MSSGSATAAPGVLLVAVSLGLGLAGAGCAGKRSVWLAPNLASPDMARLFTNPEEWPAARSRLDVFQFYAQQLSGDPACAECGDNVLERLVSAGAFRRLREWRIAAAVEVGAVKEWGCSAEKTLPAALRAIDNGRRAGGSLAFAAMDEPLLGGERCSQPQRSTVAETVRFARALRAAHPRLQVGDVEPYPHFSAAELVAWLAALRAAGERPAFFHLDVDHARAAREGRDLASDLGVVQAACRSLEVPFGVIFFGGDGLSEDEYAARVLGWIDTVRAAGVDVPHRVFQSWAASADGRREVPRNLPENDPTLWTHTRLLLTGLDRLRASASLPAP